MSVGLNIGCGRIRIPGHLGVDLEPAPTVDIVADLLRFPWPFDDSSVDSIVAWHFLEHFPDMKLDLAMKEIHRILKSGGTLYVKVPYKERGPYNPYHFHVFNENSFGCWLGRSDEDPALQAHPTFRRVKQEIVVLGGFPFYHIRRYLPGLAQHLFEHDERGMFMRFPMGSARELREWLVKPP